MISPFREGLILTKIKPSRKFSNLQQLFILCLLGGILFCHMLLFFPVIFFENSISVKQFGSRSGPTYCPNSLQNLSADDTCRWEPDKTSQDKTSHAIFDSPDLSCLVKLENNVNKIQNVDVFPAKIAIVTVYNKNTIYNMPYH